MLRIKLRTEQEYFEKLLGKPLMIEDGMKVLHLGCGINYIDGAINTDQTPVYDEFLDMDNIPYRWKDNTFDMIIAISTIMEVKKSPNSVIEECHRLLKPDGVLLLAVPYYNSFNAFRVNVNRHFFTMNSFDHYDVNYKEKTCHNWLSNKPKFTIKKYLRGSTLGMLIPHWIRNFIGIHIGNIGENIYFVMWKK